jgi:hypothetical protein
MRPKGLWTRKRRPDVDRRRRFLARANRLYEQESGEPFASSRLGEYGQRWVRWTTSGSLGTPSSSLLLPLDIAGRLGVASLMYMTMTNDLPVLYLPNAPADDPIHTGPPSSVMSEFDPLSYDIARWVRSDGGGRAFALCPLLEPLTDSCFANTGTLPTKPTAVPRPSSPKTFHACSSLQFASAVCSGSFGMPRRIQGALLLFSFLRLSLCSR